MGASVPKQYLEIAGRSVLLHTLTRLAAHPGIAGLVVVLAPGDPLWPGLTQIQGKPVRTAMGGSERADSVLAGLRALPARVDPASPVLVHDAARPLLRRDDIDRLLREGHGCAQGAILAAPVRDTLKRADDAGRSIARTEPRAGLWRALTPQMAPRGVLEHALADAVGASVVITDEAMALERIGLRPRLVDGSGDNLKLTTPEDLAFAEFWLARNG